MHAATPAVEARGETVERLLAAAETEFAIHGFDAARLEDIAAGAGVRRASLLYHFASKQVLYDRILDRAFSDLSEAMVGALAMSTATHAERLADVVGRSFDTFQRRPAFAQLILRDALDNRAERGGFAAERARRYVAPLLALGDAFFQSAQAAGEFRPGLDARDVLMLFASALLFHAAQCDAQRDVLWGDGRARGRGVKAHRASLIAMVRALVVLESPGKSSAKSRERGAVTGPMRARRSA